MSILTRTTNNFTFRNYHNDSSYLWFVAAQRLQWRIANSLSGATPTITFPLPFTTTNYWCFGVLWGNGGKDYMIGYINSGSKTISNCKLFKDSDTATYDILIAGY